MTTRALFIGGCGRSGTTMLGDLLGVPAAHVVTPESSFKLGLVQRFCWRRVLDRDASERALEWLAAHRKFREFGVALEPMRAELAGLDLRGALDRLVSTYQDRFGKPDADVWIDHTPTNIQMGLALLDAYPASRIVHLVRDGRAIAASVIPLDWGPNDVISAARFWRDSIAYGLALEQARPDRVRRLAYEDLVRDPARHLRDICDFAGLEYEPAMLRGGGLVLPASHSSQHALVGKPPDPSRLDAWRRKLSPRQTEMFENEVGELLPLLGYERDFAVPRRTSLFVEAYYSARNRLLVSGVNRWRKRRRMVGAGFRPRTAT